MAAILCPLQVSWIPQIESFPDFFYIQYSAIFYLLTKICEDGFLYRFACIFEKKRF
jgi:hypothetical protein